jgi:hypothetical protein
VHNSSERARQAPTVCPHLVIEDPPEHHGPSGEEPSVGPDGIHDFPPDYLGPTEDPTVGPDGLLEFPPDYIGTDSAGAGAAGGSVG